MTEAIAIVRTPALQLCNNSIIRIETYVGLLSQSVD